MNLLLIEKMNQNNVSNLSKTQSVIRNKFAKAHANRLENEHDVEQALQPLVSKTENHVDSVNIENSVVDLNELCNRLRFLLTTQCAGKADHTKEINAIISKLCELKILI